MVQKPDIVYERVIIGCRFFILFFLAVISFSVCNAHSSATFPFRVEFRNMVDSVPMKLGNSYKNPFGEDYTIKMFKYYISNISFQDSDGKTIKFADAHLINEDDSSSRTINLNLPDAPYTSVSFLVGVDSILNVSNIQTGSLDPLEGMFWTWNSGYIMAKLEAISPVSTVLNKSVNYHIGGYRTGQNTSRVITIPLSVHREKNIAQIIIEANVNSWFNAVHTLKIIDHSMCTTPGNLANEYADNYSKMFRLAVNNH